jgi:hypothetical protein
LVFLIFALIATVVCFALTMLIRRVGAGWSARQFGSDGKQVENEDEIERGPGLGSTHGVTPGR